MTVTLDLTPEIEARLRGKAARIGLDVDTYLHRLVEEETRPAPDAENEALIRLLEQWSVEDAGMTDEEAEQAEADWQQLRANLNANRELTGEEPLFP